MLLAVLRICLGDGRRKRDMTKGRQLEDGVMQGALHLEVKGKTQSKAIQFMATKNCQTCPGAPGGTPGRAQHPPAKRTGWEVWQKTVASGRT